MPRPPLRRLLNIFPVASLRSEFGIGGRTKMDVIDRVVTEVDILSITQFVEHSMDLTKQHVHLFEHDVARLGDLPRSVLTSFDPEKLTRSRGSIEFFYLVPLEYRYVAGSPPEEGVLEFPWPVRLVFRADVLEVHLTTMEKDLESYLEGLQPIYSVRRNLENRDILRDLKETLAPDISLAPLDINRGVKRLWATNIIDAPRAAWKSAVSTKTDAMDGEYLMKRDDPTEYAQAIRCPLLKTIFKVLDPELDWPEILMIDASNGEIGVPRYSKSVEAVKNVLGEILRNN